MKRAKGVVWGAVRGAWTREVVMETEPRGDIRAGEVTRGRSARQGANVRMTLLSRCAVGSKRRKFGGSGPFATHTDK